jgi:hypothetical protein
MDKCGSEAGVVGLPIVEGRGKSDTTVEAATNGGVESVAITIESVRETRKKQQE